MGSSNVATSSNWKGSSNTLADAPATRLVLVRHGEANCNADGFVGGHTGCTGLTARGIRQVEALRDRWKGSGELGNVDLLFSSTLPRARETAAILAPAIGNLEVQPDRELCEFHTGEEADGIPWSVFEERYTVDFRHDPFAPPYEGPGWESLEEFRFRVGRALYRLANEHAGQTMVLAVHGGIVDVAMSVFLGIPASRTARPADFYTYNASVTEWVRPAPAEDGPAKWRLVRYNDAAHCTELT